MKCLIIDDEPLAQDVLQSHTSKIEDLVLVGTCKNAIEAAEFLKNNEVDLLFLDIQMPEVSGIDVFKSIKNPPLVIFTTAYPEFAVEGFELNAIDYLLKPVSFDRFEKAIEKAREYFKFKKGEGVDTTEIEDDFIYVKANQKLVKLSYDDILYVEAFADYVKIYIPEKRIVTLQTMKNMEKKLPADRFSRVHRSFIIGMQHIKAFSSSEVEVNGQKIPIGKNYKDDFLTIMNSKNIL
jgi:DNA-binding LytR/AlgR family response regulator